ncbi:MAG: hypothetical protein ACRENN_10015 [Candidatus Eiseniibacteriota bacterium]
MLFLSAVVSFSTWVGCGDDDKNSNNGGGGGGGATTSSFAGWLANNSETGLLTVTISKAGLAHPRPGSLAPGASVSATGSLILAGTTTAVPLTGTFDDQSGVLDLSSSGGTPYVFTGAYDPGPPSNCTGSYTGPNGDGQFATETGAASSAQVYGGTYASIVTSSTGTFLMTIRGTAIEGLATEDGSTFGQPFTGALNGTSVTISAPSTGGFTLSGAGNINLTTHHTNGDYDITEDATHTTVDSGTWDGDLITTPTP